MGRSRAADHDAKRAILLRAAARLFASHGYDRTSLAMIAERCGISKALFYHYYRDKAALLGDIIREHLAMLDRSLEAADDPRLQPEDRLRELVLVLLTNYRDADAEHQVQVAHLKLLPARVQEELRELERRLVRRFSAVVALLAPRLEFSPKLRMPLTMSLFGMANWMFLWWREEGPLRREEYAAMVAALIAAGSRELTAREATVVDAERESGPRSARGRRGVAARPDVVDDSRAPAGPQAVEEKPARRTWIDLESAAEQPRRRSKA